MMLNGLAVAISVRFLDRQNDTVEYIRNAGNISRIHMFRFKFAKNGLIGSRIRQLLGHPYETRGIVVPHGASEFRITIIMNFDQFYQGFLIDQIATRGPTKTL